MLASTSARGCDAQSDQRKPPPTHRPRILRYPRYVRPVVLVVALLLASGCGGSRARTNYVPPSPPANPSEAPKGPRAEIAPMRMPESIEGAPLEGTGATWRSAGIREAAQEVDEENTIVVVTTCGSTYLACNGPLPRTRKLKGRVIGLIA